MGRAVSRKRRSFTKEFKAEVVQLCRVEKANHGIVILCRVLEVSRSGFYRWRGRPASATDKANARMTAEISAVHRGSRATYGSPRVHAELQAQGHTVSRNRVARLMRLEGLQARRKRRFRTTTDSRHNLPIAPNERVGL